MEDEKSRESELEQRIEELERRLGRRERSADARPAAETAFWALMHRIFPDDARSHMRAATREQLLTARTYIDRWIARLEHGGEAAPPEEPREQIKVD